MKFNFGQSHIALRFLDVFCILAPAFLLASILGIGFLNSSNLPTGGDAASHLLYAWLYSNELLPNGQITAWVPEVFAGMPFLSYYFPLPFIGIAVLNIALPFAVAMKWGMFAAALLLPGAVWLGGVYLLRLPRSVALWGIPAAMAFLLHEQHSIWGGNLLSTLSGEFAYSYGMLFAFLTLCAWQRLIATGKNLWLVVLLEAATGFSHGFTLLVTGFATTAYLFERGRFVNNLRWLIIGHGLAFMLLGGWLWPLLQMHGYTIPNDALFEVQNWLDLLPSIVQPLLAAGVVAAIVWTMWRVLPIRRWVPILPEDVLVLRHAAFMASAALLAGVMFLAGSQLGLANIRFYPMVLLLGSVACAWVWGALLRRLMLQENRLRRAGGVTLSVAALCAMAGWISLHVHRAPDWGLWNHSGLEAKPNWQHLSQLFPVMSGTMQSPRLVFEHDPANSDIGSTRALEALPMFLGGRPVLEGLYMESALASPAIYQLQSELSVRPSSPLARFPSGSLDVEMAARHMRWLYTNQVLVRSSQAQQALAASAQFYEVARMEPFYVYQLKELKTQLVDIVQQPIKWYPRKGWMEESFRWFRSSSRLDTELPVFTDQPPSSIQPAGISAKVSDISLDRSNIRFKTNVTGVPHLVRMAWHPRWQLQSKGQLYLAGPGFMIVVPEEGQVHLHYGHTTLGWFGMLSSSVVALVMLALVLLAWRNKVLFQSQDDAAPWPSSWWAGGWPLLLLVVGIVFHAKNPERLYADAWVEMRANQYHQAAPIFDRAFAGRKSEAKKEEALFWSAKAHELSGNGAEALIRYRQLTAQYHGYWLPEALYTQGVLARQQGYSEEAHSAHARLLSDYPNDRWAQRLRQETSAP